MHEELDERALVLIIQREVSDPEVVGRDRKGGLVLASSRASPEGGGPRVPGPEQEAAQTPTTPQNPVRRIDALPKRPRCSVQEGWLRAALGATLLPPQASWARGPHGAVGGPSLSPAGGETCPEAQRRDRGRDARGEVDAFRKARALDGGRLRPRRL